MEETVERRVPKLRLALLLGSLSMLYGEVYAGSSTFWMVGAWSLMITFPLYTFHSLFYLNLAQRTKRTTLPHLYFWGLLFALYEAPITKVLWSGFLGTTGPGWGLVSGVAIMEFMIIVLFWHPLMSFMMPILSLQMILQSAAHDGSAVFPSNLPLLTWNGKSKAFFIMITVITSFLMTYNDITIGLLPDLVLAPSIALIVVIKVAIPTKGKGIRIQAFRFGNVGFTIIIMYMVALYIWAVPNIIPMTLVMIVATQPGSLFQGIITLAVFAAIVCIVLGVSGPDALADAINPTVLPDASTKPERLMTTRHLVGLWGLMALLLLLWSMLLAVFAVLALVDIAFGICLPCLGVTFIIGMSIGLYRNKKAKMIRKS